MKTILLMFDTLNRRYLSPYGCTWTATPNFQRLAEHCVTFDQCYGGSMPCMPARRELHTARYNFLHRSWGPLEPFDDSVPEMLRKHGIYTHMISDHQHYWEDGGATYHHRYDSWEIVRGQEGDRWKGEVSSPQIPTHIGRAWRQDLINRTYMQKEEEHPLAKVFKLGMEFLKKNQSEDNWFLHWECFDPHEPFFSMPSYEALYPHEYDGPAFDWPEYRYVTENDEEVQHCRYKYASLLSMCDHYLGEFLDYMDENSLWDDTMVIVNTDHGFLLGEHDSWAKSVHPWYDETIHIPLFIWDPRYHIKGERRQSLVQTIDIPVTLLSFFGIEPTHDMQGCDLTPTIREDKPVRKYALFGMFGAQVNITDGRYVYMREANEDNMPLYNYTLMPTHMRTFFSAEELRTMEYHAGFSFTKNIPVMKIVSREDTSGDTTLKCRRGNLLFDLQTDPRQCHPIHDEALEEVMIKQMIYLMRENEAPAEQFERLGLL